MGLPHRHAVQPDMARVDNMHVKVVCAIYGIDPLIIEQLLTITRLIMDVHPDATTTDTPLILHNSPSISPEVLEHAQVRLLAEIAHAVYVRVRIECEQVEGRDIGCVPFHVGKNEEVRRGIQDIGCFSGTYEDVLDPGDEVSLWAATWTRNTIVCVRGRRLGCMV
jgi:hypothetical protein